MNCLVFDMDETLGFFSQISRIWFPLQELNNNALSDYDFFSLCDLFPQMLRPKITEFLRYCKKLKQVGVIDKIILYTNNTGPEWWPKIIVSYIEYKAGESIFDVIIPGFNKKIKSNCRKNELKSYDDLVRCSKIPPTSKVCFYDDQPHRNMESHKYVTTVYVNSYNYFYTNSEIFLRLKKLKFYKPIYQDILKTSLEEHLLEYNSKANENTDLKEALNMFVKKIKTSTKSRTRGKTKSKSKTKSVKQTKSKTKTQKQSKKSK